MTVQETCQANGTFGMAMTCVSSTCAVDHCTGVCTVGAARCDVNGVTPQTCDATGTWVSGTDCVFGCVGAGVCADAPDGGSD
jgi:hypothetical protein